MKSAKAAAYVEYLKTIPTEELGAVFSKVIGEDMVRLFTHYANHIFRGQPVEIAQKGRSALMIGYLIHANEVGVVAIPEMRN